MKKLFFYSMILVFLFSGAKVSFAGIPGYTLLEPLPCVPTTAKPSCTPGEVIPKFTIDQFVEYVYKFSIALIVLLATIQVIWGGFLYMGEGSYASKSEAKTKFKSAATGIGGALISFLVLQTIDPRLVQIHSKIDPICPVEAQNTVGSVCNPAGGLQFTNQLDADLKNLNTENITQVNNLQKEIDGKKQRIDEINYKEENDPEGLTPQEIADREKLKQEVIAGQSKQTQIISTGTANVYFKGAMNAIHNLSEYDDNGKLNAYAASGLELQKDQVTAAYNRALSDPSIANNPAAKQTLQFEKDYYLGQVNQEKIFMERIAHYNNFDFKTIDLPMYTAELDATKKRYQAEYDGLTKDGTLLDETLTKIKADPVVFDQHKAILLDRIDKINKVEQKRADELGVKK